jgi:hypothetical protein
MFKVYLGVPLNKPELMLIRRKIMTLNKKRCLIFLAVILILLLGVTMTTAATVQKDNNTQANKDNGKLSTPANNDVDKVVQSSASITSKDAKVKNKNITTQTTNTENTVKTENKVVTRNIQTDNERINTYMKESSELMNMDADDFGFNSVKTITKNNPGLNIKEAYNVYDSTEPIIITTDDLNDFSNIQDYLKNYDGELKTAKIILETGEYSYPVINTNLLNLENYNKIKNVIIEGNGAIIDCANAPTTVFNVGSGYDLIINNVTLKKFSSSVDAVTLIFSKGNLTINNSIYQITLHRVSVLLLWVVVFLELFMEIMPKSILLILHFWKILVDMVLL